jgi:NitT/TauT family transport system substrate-binding protein
MALRIMVSRHSAFYSPLISVIAAGFLEQQGLSADYSILAKGQRSSVLIREGSVDIMQSAVSSNWKPLQQGESPLPVHFAQINQRDGFLLIARKPHSAFEWKDLEGKSLIADHALQPLVMLKYAVRLNGVDWRRIDIVDAGAPEEMELAFRRGAADYVHLQAPASDQLEQDGLGRIVVSVGKSMPPVAFSSLCCSRDFLHTERCRSFLEAFRQARKWVRSARAEEVAQKERDLFPGISAEALTAAIRRYQTIGCWDGDPEIPRDLYEQALTVFESEGEINRRHAYEQVCGAYT